MDLGAVGDLNVQQSKEIPMKRSMKILLAAVIASALFATVAAAHTVKYDATVKAKVKKGGKEAGTFSGTVESTSARCSTNREVKVYLRNSNPPDTLIGADFTDTAGAWELIPASEIAPGTYYAVVSKSVLKKNKKHRHVCKPGQSADLSVK